ncbi:MAG: LPS assembly protein LptD [Sulfurimonas sp.]
MLKLIPLLLLLVVSLFAADKVEIYSSNMTSTDNIVKATDGVTVVYKSYFLTAKKAIYNRDTGDLELFDNIVVNNDKKAKVIGSYAKLNIKKKEKLFKPFYMLDTKSKVWMSASEGRAKDKDLDITSGTTSGCDPLDPLWTMDFSSSDYNADSMWLNLYNARIYIHDIPIFYTPWFGYSLDTKRRTGLLKPAFGISSTEGFFYEQPIYIAEQDWWDLELNPQVRTSRGSGIYSKFRFLDSRVSRGEFKMGYFKEKETYFKENNLLNDSHFGFNFNYDNRDVINQWFGTNLQGQSGLYVDLNHMNDVDYINLSSNQSINQSTATQVLSRINMFYNTNNHYFGAYFKYYQDLTLSSNKGTPQKLPTLQYHNYLNTFLQDHVLYSLDIQSNNIQREKDKKVLQTNINLPITLQTDMFDEFLNLSYTANLSGQHSQFTGSESDQTLNTEYDNGYTVKNYHTLSASTQLTKAYEEITHVISFGVTYTHNGFESKNGFYQDYKEFCSDPVNSTTPECEYYNITDVENATQLDFIQYIYDSSAKQILYHRLSQNIIDSSVDNKYGDLENELDYKITDTLSYYNNLFYNYDNAIFTKAINRIAYADYGINLALSHLYRDLYIKTTDTHTYTSYLTSSLRYTYNKHYSYDFRYNYDMELQEKKNMEIGFLYKKRCWEFGIKYAEDNRPILDASGQPASVYDKYIYFTITLKPFMQPSANSSAFVYKLPGQTQ